MNTKAFVISAAAVLSAACGGPEAPLHGTLTLRYLVTHVRYTPPGAANTIAYDRDGEVGPGVRLAPADGASLTISARPAGPVPTENDTGDFTAVPVDDAGSSVALNVRLTAAAITQGSSLTIDNGDDEVWLLVNPRLELRYFASTNHLEWQLSPEQRLQHVAVHARELRTPEAMSPATRELLDRAGITPDLYPQLASADPLPTDAEQLGAPRFELLERLIYRPSAGSTLTSDLTQLPHAHVGAAPLATFSTPFDLEGDAALVSSLTPQLEHEAGRLSVRLTASPVARSSHARLTLELPPLGYDGPQFVELSLDTLWRTFLFRVRWPPNP